MEERQVYCNRTLNLRSIRAIGYDMDYTLIHYQEKEWESRAYEHIKQQLIQLGWPIHHLKFEPNRVCRGLIVDTENGNLVKANRFGFIKHSMHGTKPMGFEAQRDTYSRTIIDLNEKRWVFLHTLFSLSEGCIYAQLVDLLDEKKIPEVLGYANLYDRVRQTLDTAHMEGKLKAEIIADPDRFVVLDPDMPLALLDQKNAGKKLLLITNSEWTYTQAMMTYTFDRFLPKGTTWQDLFDVVIVYARKPLFFTTPNPFFEVVTKEGLLRPAISTQLRPGTAYLGGNAREVERQLGLSGDEILYVGDHMFGDVHFTKSVLRWRTALIIRELEDEINSLRSFRAAELKLSILMESKEKLEDELSQVRLHIQRGKHHYGPESKTDSQSLLKRQDELRTKIVKLDQEIAPIARGSGELNNPFWGLLMRAGNDKSHLAYQLERYADIYTSRVSNFLQITPFVYLRSMRGSLPHDLLLTKMAEQSEPLRSP